MNIFSKISLLGTSNLPKPWRRAFRSPELATLTGGDWTSITYGNGKYLVKNDNYLSTSLDGINWGTPYQVSNDTFTYSKYLMFNGSFFIAVGDKETVETSSDGINWTTQQTSGFNPSFIKSAIYNGTKFVVFDPYSYQVFLSADGLQWEGKSNEIIANGTHLAFNGEKYIVSRSNGYIAISTDLTNWTNIRPTEIYGEFTTNMYLDYDGTRFFGIYGRNISYSTDGINWTTSVTDSNLGNHDWTASTTNDIKTVLISSNGYISTKRV